MFSRSGLLLCYVKCIGGRNADPYLCWAYWSFVCGCVYTELFVEQTAQIVNFCFLICLHVYKTESLSSCQLRVIAEQRHGADSSLNVTVTWLRNTSSYYSFWNPKACYHIHINLSWHTSSHPYDPLQYFDSHFPFFTFFLHFIISLFIWIFQMFLSFNTKSFMKTWHISSACIWGASADTVTGEV